MGREAYHWVDRLSASGQRFWQILPLGPTGFGDSPYQSYSAFAGNPLLIDLEMLSERGWLDDEEPSAEKTADPGRVDYERVRAVKEKSLRKVFERFHALGQREWQERFRAFELSEVEWLEDYALFMALHRHFGDRPWNEWEEGYRRRDTAALERVRHDHFDEIEYQKFLQFLFYEQWSQLREYANGK